MNTQFNDLKALDVNAREALTTALPMLRALSGGYTAVLVDTPTAELTAACAFALDANDLSPETVKNAFESANIPAHTPFAALLKMGDTVAVIAISASYRAAAAYAKAIIEKSRGNALMLDCYDTTKFDAIRAGKFAGKTVIVTGAAQGFGAGIADSLAADGAHVVIADMNEAGAAATALELCEKYGDNAAISVGANVSDEESVASMVESAVLAFGGLDIFINNAGIVRAGSLPEMKKSDFELVTAVNYTAYFLCVKYAVVPMKLAHAVCPDKLHDVIEINSKSGLAGSNKNFAYAGSKFGGIGLTQSFAMELAEYGIKVNAVCPGNFLDGPLWSDPEKGLFVQYLRAGKIPGAKTVDDVRRAYESKVPLGRGCRVIDVYRAISYIAEQEYETGQAIPVTGGQEMLK